MTYWLAISNRENSDVTIRKLIWGVSKRHINIISRVSPGDKILIYVGQKVVDREVLPSAITAAFEVASEMYNDTSRIFTSPPDLENEVFPLRIRLNLVKIFDPKVEFKPLIPNLNFIANKKMWTGHIRGRPMREIPEEDYHLIMKQRE